MAPIKRQAWSATAYYISLVPLYLLLWPIFKLLEFTGYWPQKIIPRANTKFFIWPADLTPGKGDVMVSSYFKSGTTWMLQIATQIVWRGQAEFEHIHDLVPWPEMPSSRRLYAVNITDVPLSASPTRLRVIKTHYAPDAIPFSKEARYICVVRDPKAVFVSGYYFIRDTNMGPLMPSVKHWLELFLSEGALFGTWAGHVASCWALRNEPNVFFLTYEQLKENLPGKVAEIAYFLGVDLTAGEKASVIEKADFNYMKNIGHKFDPIGIGPPWVNTRGVMIRKGEKRTSEELLPGCNEQIDDYCCQLLKEMNSDFPYEEYYGH